MTYKGRSPFPSAAFVETQRNFTYFDKSLTSGLTDVIIESPGDFLYIDQASTGVVRVELNMRQGGSLAPITLAAGGSIECDFSSVKLTADAQLNKSIRIVVANGARIKGGANVNPSSQTVQVVSGAQVLSQAGKGFGGYSYCAGVAAQYAHAQLFNPVGSGKNTSVEKVSITNYGAGLVIWGLHNVAAASLMSASYMGNKLASGAYSVSRLRYEANVAQLITWVIGVRYIPANTTHDIEFKTPIALPPGYGFSVINNIVNTAITASFDVIEE